MSAEIVQLAPAPAERIEEPAPVQRLTISEAPDVMSPETLSQVLDGVKVATLAEWRTKDKHKPVDQMVGPPWTKLGGVIRYLKSDVADWLEAHRIST